MEDGGFKKKEFFRLRRCSVAHTVCIVLIFLLILILTIIHFLTNARMFEIFNGKFTFYDDTLAQHKNMMSDMNRTIEEQQNDTMHFNQTYKNKMQEIDEIDMEFNSILKNLSENISVKFTDVESQLKILENLINVDIAERFRKDEDTLSKNNKKLREIQHRLTSHFQADLNKLTQDLKELKDDYLQTKEQFAQLTNNTQQADPVLQTSVANEVTTSP